MLARLKNLFISPPPSAAYPAYIALVERARNPFFYETLAVPDTLDGRFELIVLHLFLLQQRLQGEDVEFSRSLSEYFFADMDQSLRELGVADTGVRYRIKAMAKAYHGRLQAYSLANDETARLSALARNLYGTVAEGSVETLKAASDYIADMQAKLAAMETAVITSEAFVWPAIATK